MATKERWSEGFCPCCGYRPAEQNPDYAGGQYGICPICNWEDDRSPSQRDLVPGPNMTTLAEAREHFRRYGASHPDLVDGTREPTRDDERDPDWPSRDQRGER